MKKEQKQKFVAAKRDVDAAIKKHGFAAIKWVVNRRIEADRLRRELASEKKRLNDRIRQIESKLKSR